MNKDILLQSLKDLQSHLPQTGVDDIAIDAQVAEIEQLIEVRRNTEESIANLQLKLKDDKNYPGEPLLYIEGLRFNLEDEVSAADKSLLSNEADISALENDIKKYQDELATVSTEISNRERKILDLGRELRKNNNPTPEQEESYQTKLTSLRGALTEYRIREQDLNSLLESKKGDLINLQARNQELKNRVIKTQNDLNAFDEKVKADGDIDLVAKNNDQEKLLELQNLLKVCDMKDSFLNYDFARELNYTINNLENDIITTDEALKNVENFKNHLPIDFINRNREENNTQRKELDKVSGDLSEEITALQNKLSDETNYYSTKKYDDQLASIRNTIANADIDIKYSDATISGYTADVTRLDRELAFSNEYISGLQEEIATWTLELGRTKNDADVEELASKIRVNQAEIDLEQKGVTNLLREQEIVKNLIKMVEEHKKISKAKKERYEALEENLTNSLDDKKTVDKYAIKADQIRLSQLEDTRKVVLNRKKYISYDLENELNSIVNRATGVIEESNEVVNNSVIEEQNIPVVEPVIKENNDFLENKDKNIFVPYTTSSKDENGNEMLGEIRNQNGDKTGDVFVNNDNSQYFTNDNEGQSTALIPYDGKSSKVISFAPANEQLNNNIKKKKIFDRIKDWLKALIKDWKKNWKKYVSVTLAAMALGLAMKSCSTSNPNGYVDDNSYSVSDEELKDEITDAIEQTPEKEEVEKDENENNKKPSKVPAGETIDSTIITSPEVPKDTVGGIVEDKTEIVEDSGNVAPTPELPPVHEGPIDSSAGGGNEPGWSDETITGGGQIGETEEEFPTPEQKPDVTPNPGEGGNVVDEVVDDDVVLPDLGGGEIVDDSSFTVDLDQANNEVYNANTETGQVSVDAAGNVAGDTNAVSDVAVNDDQTTVTMDSSLVTSNEPDSDVSEYDFNEIMKQLLGDETVPVEEETHTRGGM